MKALPIDACATENLSTLLANGATIDAFLKVSACPRDARSMYENVTFSPGEEEEKEEDIGKTVRSAFAPVVEDYQDEKNGTVVTNSNKKKGVNVVGLSVSLAVVVVCFAGVALFVVYRDKTRQKLNALYVQRNHDAERNVTVATRR